MEESDPLLIPFRGLNEFTYCPRLFHILYVQGIFDDSIDTLEGSALHQKPLSKGKVITPEQGEEIPIPWSSQIVKEMILSSEKLKIYGKFDVILEQSNHVVPVEVKHGPAPDGNNPFYVNNIPMSGDAWNNDQIQLAAQMALLREMGYSCINGKLFYRETKQLINIEWTENLDKVLQWVISQALEIMKTSQMPSPLVNSNKCIRCSVNHICLPDETLFLDKMIDEPRQLYPGRDDKGILHIITPGTHVSKSSTAIKVIAPKQQEVIIPMKDIGHICIFGNSQITSQALLDIVEQGSGVTWLSGSGWLRAVTTAPLSKNVMLRREQYKACDDSDICLCLSKNIVESKVENQRVLLRRNGDTQADSLHQLKKLKQKVMTCEDKSSLLGIEGMSAKVYWDSYPSLFKAKDGETLQMTGRSRRPPKDPVNALLSYGYALLLRDFMSAIYSVGMDPLYGFYHAIVPGRPALALDLMEPFRPLVVDSAVLRGINEGSFSPKDFIEFNGSTILKQHTKKKLIEVYERRVDEFITHPTFGYRLNYRRVFSLEARLLGRFIMGELAEYHPLTTR